MKQYYLAIMLDCNKNKAIIIDCQTQQRGNRLTTALWNASDITIFAIDTWGDTDITNLLPACKNAKVYCFNNNYKKAVAEIYKLLTT